jgi:hypothetical protein
MPNTPDYERLENLLEKLCSISRELGPAKDPLDSAMYTAMQALPAVYETMGIRGVLRYLARIRMNINRGKHRQIVILERQARIIAENAIRGPRPGLT